METTIWDIGLDAWIIQDGNYPDFEVGQIAEFALEFFIPHGVSAQPSDVKVFANKLENSLYDVVADVLVHTDQITVLDLGVLAYQPKTSLPPSPRVAVQLNLGVDAFHNFSFTRETGDVLPLVYSWKILSILRQTAPFIETAPRYWMRDPQRLGYEEIPRTDAWHDDGGRADYLLRCELLPIPPRRERATAT
jgi:hypothetical protein